jgi:hypothetical protein
MKPPRRTFIDLRLLTWFVGIVILASVLAVGIITALLRRS